MVKHNEGPWAAWFYTDNSAIEIKDNNYNNVLGVLYDTCQDNNCLTKQDMVNANLMAASPEMLSALEYALEFLIDNNDGENDVVNRIKACKKAINKAKRGCYANAF